MPVITSTWMPCVNCIVEDYREINMEHKIGTVITLPDGRKAKVVAGGGVIRCTECVLLASAICSHVRCRINERDDHKNIIYKEIKEE